MAIETENGWAIETAVLVVLEILVAWQQLELVAERSSSSASVVHVAEALAPATASPELLLASPQISLLSLTAVVAGLSTILCTGTTTSEPKPKWQRVIICEATEVC